MEDLCTLISEVGLLRSNDVMDLFLRRLIKAACFSGDSMSPSDGGDADGQEIKSPSSLNHFVKYPVGSNERAVALLTALCEQVKQQVKQTSLSISKRERGESDKYGNEDIDLDLDLPEGLRSSVVYDHMLDMVESLLDGGERACAVYYPEQKPPNLADSIDVDTSLDKGSNGANAYGYDITVPSDASRAYFAPFSGPPCDSRDSIDSQNEEERRHTWLAFRQAVLMGLLVDRERLLLAPTATLIRSQETPSSSSSSSSALKKESMRQDGGVSGIEGVEGREGRELIEGQGLPSTLSHRSQTHAARRATRMGLTAAYARDISSLVYPLSTLAPPVEGENGYVYGTANGNSNSNSNSNLKSSSDLLADERVVIVTSVREFQSALETIRKIVSPSPHSHGEVDDTHENTPSDGVMGGGCVVVSVTMTQEWYRSYRGSTCSLTLCFACKDKDKDKKGGPRTFLFDIAACSPPNTNTVKPYNTVNIAAGGEEGDIEPELDTANTVDTKNTSNTANSDDAEPIAVRGFLTCCRELNDLVFSNRNLLKIFLHGTVAMQVSYLHTGGILYNMGVH